MSKKVTIVDIAKISGFGVGTVSRVLSNDKNVKQSTREAILKVIEETNYTPNVNSVRLRKKHTGVIAVLVPIINHPFFAEFVENVNIIAMKKGYSILLVTSKMNVDKEKEILQKIKRKEVDGAIFVTHYNHDDSELKNCCLVSVDRHLNHNVPYVSSDNYEASRNAIEYLISKGARKIGYIGTKPYVESEVLLREKAYLDVMKEQNMKARLLNKVIEHGEEEKLVDKFLNEFTDLDAIFSSGTTITQIIYSKLTSMNVRLPDDVQLIGYDGLFNAWSGDTKISCIDQPIKELAEGAFNILLDLINGKEVQQRTIYKTTFLKGETTK